MSQQETDKLLSTLQNRFEKHKTRHPDINWSDVLEKIKGNPKKLKVLAKMEETGGEPDVIAYDAAAGEFLFVDCASESPKPRRSLCYDRKALDDRKEFKPAGSAMEMAAEIGVEMLNEEQYRQLQQVGEFDLKTSSWIATPEKIRKLGGAIFCDKRYDTIFVYHNGASSYYASRGFRGLLRV